MLPVVSHRNLLWATHRKWSESEKTIFIVAVRKCDKKHLNI